MSMEHEIENLVSLLNKHIPSVSQDNSRIALQTKEACSSIKEALSTTSYVASHTISILLSRDKGILFFLSNLEKCQETILSDNIKIILEIIELALTKFGENVDNSLVNVKDAVMKYLHAKEALLRKLAYKVLILIVDAAAHNNNHEETEKLKLHALVNQMFVSLGQSSFDNAASVKKNFFTLLGHLARHFPHLVQDRAGRIMKHVIRELEKEVKSNYEKMEHALIIGYIEALSGLLDSFHNNYLIVSPNELEKLHSLLLEVVFRGLSGKKRDSSRAALTVALSHSAIFNKRFLGSYKEWLECLKFYALHKNPEDTKIGTKMFSKFMGEISRELRNKAPDSFPQKAEIVEFFVRHMFEILESNEASTKLKMLAMKALGDLSRSVSTSNALLIFDYISKKAIYLCLQEDVTKNVLAQYPVCLEAIGMLLSQHGSTTMRNEQLCRLQKICVQIFSRYLDIAEKKQYLCGRAVVVFFIGIWSSLKNSIDFAKFVGETVTQGLIRSSRPELNADDLKKYSSLWSDVMNFSRHADLPLTLEAHVSVTQTLDEQLIASLSDIIKRLNFNVEESEKSVEAEEKDYELIPKNLNDWQLLENLADLLIDIVKATEPKERLVNYLIPFGVKVMAASHQHPYVLGFHRLLALVLQVVGDNMPTSEQRSYQNFLKILITRLPQMSIDSLMSSVQAVLASPAWLVSAIKDSISSALVSALKIGLTNLKLASWPLNALKLWQARLNLSDFEQIMVEVAPHLELYLHTPEQREKDVYLIRGSRMKNHAPLDAQTWNRTQREVLKLLGDMGPSCSRFAIKDKDEIISRVATEWRAGSELNLKLPLNDIEVSISIDVFLPHALHLVYHSGDPKVRLPACEFLHAACVFLIGTTSQQREDYKSSHPSTHLYSKLFPAILDLAVDADATVRVLFENLLAQVVHWFSRPSFYSKDLTGRETILGTEAGLLVEVLMDTVCSEDDTSLAREVAANSLKEFLDWAIKQSSDSVLRSNPAVPEFVFQKLRVLATHPSPKQRLGAAVICNYICSSVQRCEPLMSLFTLDLFAHFLISLSMADKDLAEVGTQERCESALCRLGRVVYLNKNIFSTPDPHRRTAPLLIKGTIAEINELLMQHFFSEHSRTRRLAINICRALLRPVSIVTYAKDFLEKFHLDTFLSNASFRTTLDVCRLMLHHNVIRAEDCKEISPFKKKYEDFLHSLSTSLENWTTHDDEYPSIILTWLEFLTEYLSKAKDYSLLPVDSAVRALLLPSHLGFPSNALKLRQDFYDHFRKLCPSLKEHRQAVLSAVSLFKFDPCSANFSDANTLDLLHGLSILASFDLLDLATLKINNPTVLLKAAIDPLIAKCKTGECSKQTKASSWLLEIAIHLGLGMDLLAAELKDPSTIPGTPFIKGQYVRAKLGASLWKTILERPRYILPCCPELGNGDPQQWDLLNEFMLAALHLKETWVAGKLLESWPVLVEHAKSYGEMSRFRSFVNTLMRLDLKRVSESIVVKRWIIDSWNDQNSDVNFAKEAAQLLKIYAVDCTPSEENDVVNALNKFFSSHFASKTTDLRTDLEKSDYFSVFNLLLDVADSLPVCSFLVEVFALEPQHPRAASFTQWMNGWMKGAPLPFLSRLFERLSQRTTVLTVPAMVRIQAVETLYGPLLSAAPTAAIDAHFQGELQVFAQASKESLLVSESILRRTVLCCILPIFITRLGYQPLISKHNLTYCTLENISAAPDGKNLLRSITKFALDIRKLTAPPSGIDVDLFQRLHGSAFKLIQSIASISAMDESSVDKLVFKPLTPALWNAIVGTTKEYTLSAQVDRRKKQFLVHLPTPSDDTESNYGYAPSQFLYASSLSEDVYRFDFNHASVTTQTTYVGSKTSLPRIVEQEENITSFNLTLNEINQHHVMAPLVAFLREQGDKMLKTQEKVREPPWMGTLRETLVHPSIHRNVVLFIVRLLLNLEPLFRTFAQSWYNPLLMILFRRIGGEPLNFLFRDGLEMILDWCKENPPQASDKEFIKLASSIVEFVAKNVAHGETEAVKDNKEMFRAMLNVWEGLPLEMPRMLVNEMLHASRSNQIIALLLLDAMTHHGFLRGTDIEWETSLKNRLVELLSDSDKRDVLRTTSFVCGSMLARHPDVVFETRIVEELVKFHTKGKPDVFTDALFEITRHHASILRLAKFPYLNLNLLPSLYGTLKARCIEILSESWQYMEDPWKEIGRGTFEDILKKTNPAELTPMLKLLTLLIPRLELADWLPLWGRLTRIAQHENVACRSKLYELFKRAFDIAPSKAEFAQALLRACTDQNQELASSVQNFLSEKLPNTAVDRVFAYLKQFYLPANEHQFLPYFSYFVLERTTKSPRYREPIFDRPLADVPFEVLDLSFLSSQTRTQSIRGTGSFLSPGTLRGGFLRATQQPTYQTFGTQGSTNWLMSEMQSQDQLEGSRHLQSPTKSKSSLAVPSSPVKAWKRFADASATPPSPEKRSSYTSRRKVEKNVNQPTIYRRYRTGELPDVQIPLSALLAPLQALALLDPLIAKSLFCSLLSAVCEKIKEVQGDNQDFVAHLSDLLKDLLYAAEEQGSSANIISAIFEYLWSSGVQLEVEAEKIHSAAKKHHRRQLGILVLEALLPTETAKEDGAQQPKKQKISTGHTQSPNDWFLVADSYADIDDMDSARATIIRLTDCEETTMRAIECEMARDWEGAFSYYSRSISSPSSSHREESICKEYQFKCLEVLGEWEEIKHLQPDIEPWSTRSFLREALQSTEPDLSKQLDLSSLASIDVALYPELAALALKIGRKDKAAYYVSKMTEDFLVRYGLPSQLDFRVRRTLLERVSLVTEVQKFLDDSFSSKQHSLPKPGDNTLVWDSILSIRNSLKNLADLEISDHLTILPLELAAVAIEQKNFLYARKLAENLVNIPQSKVARHKLLLGKIYAMQQLRRKDPSKKLENLIRAKTTISQIRNLEELKDQLDLAKFESELCFKVASLGEESPIVLESKRSHVEEVWNVPIGEMIQTGLQHLRRCTEMCEEHRLGCDAGNAYYTLARYIHKCRTQIPADEFHREFTSCVMKSMKFGSKDGTSLFPVVIVMVKDSQVAQETFIKEIDQVPLNAFLTYVNQLVSYCASAPVFEALLIQMAKIYPVNVLLPLQVSRRNFESHGQEPIVNRVESQLPEDIALKMFLKSIDYLRPPEKVAWEVINRGGQRLDFEIFKTKYLNLAPPSKNSPHGDIHFKFSEAFSTKFEKAFREGSFDDLKESLARMTKTTKPGVAHSLLEYSPWIANYRFGEDLCGKLLLPVSKGRTLRIESFRDDIRFIASKQFPVKLTLIINGAKELSVLVKHGEDVRQDERIVQLLDMIDAALLRDEDSRRRNLRIRTFQVVPLSITCGLFEWVEGTVPLKAFLESDQKFKNSLKKLNEERKKIFAHKNSEYYLRAPQEQLNLNFQRMANQTYPYGLRDALKRLSQSAEAYFYLRQRFACSLGAQSSALWILGIGDRHLSNTLVSVKTGDVIPIDYGMAFGMATSNLPVPELAPCRLTTQFQKLIPGLGLNGPIRESMVHTLRVARIEIDTLLAALAVFVTEPTLDWSTHAKTLIEDQELGTSGESSVSWSRKEVMERTESILRGAHPAAITTQDLQQNPIYKSQENRNSLAVISNILRGDFPELSKLTDEPTKRKFPDSNSQSIVLKGLEAEEQVEFLIRQSTENMVLCRMYHGWEPWI